MLQLSLVYGLLLKSLWLALRLGFVIMSNHFQPLDSREVFIFNDDDMISVYYPGKKENNNNNKIYVSHQAKLLISQYIS